MAEIHSAQNGAWPDTDTWGGGVVPDLSKDYAGIHHAVTIEVADTLAMSGAGEVNCQSGTLVVEGSLTAGIDTDIFLLDSNLIIKGTVTLVESVLQCVMSPSYLRIDPGGLLDVEYMGQILDEGIVGGGVPLITDIRAGGRIRMHELSVGPPLGFSRVLFQRREDAIKRADGLLITDFVGAYGFAGPKRIGV